jgi:Lon protease-like protein
MSTRTRLRLFPLNAVLFPGAVLNVHVFEPRYKHMIGECLQSGENFGVVLIRDGAETGDPGVQPHQVGSVAEIIEVTQLPLGRYYIATVGRERFRIRDVVSREPFLTAEVDFFDDDQQNDSELTALCDDVHGAFLEYLQLIAQFSGEQSAVDLPRDANTLSFVIGDALQVADAIKQRLLELHDTKQRLSVELGVLKRLLPQLRELLERRTEELEGGDTAERQRRGDQERYFGKYFSAN